METGEGGGAGVGYQTGAGLSGWLTADGSEWEKLNPAYGFAVEALTTERDQWTETLARLNKSLRQSGELEIPEVVEFTTGMRAAQPNPFNPMTTLQFTLKESGRVELDVYDLQGRLVKRLASRTYSAGEHQLTWYGRDDDGREVSSGLYLARFRSGGFEKTERLVLVR